MAAISTRFDGAPSTATSTQAKDPGSKPESTPRPSRSPATRAGVVGLRATSGRATSPRSNAWPATGQSRTCFPGGAPRPARRRDVHQVNGRRKGDERLDRDDQRQAPDHRPLLPGREQGAGARIGGVHGSSTRVAPPNRPDQGPSADLSNARAQVVPCQSPTAVTSGHQGRVSPEADAGSMRPIRAVGRGTWPAGIRDRPGNRTASGERPAGTTASSRETDRKPKGCRWPRDRGREPGAPDAHPALQPPCGSRASTRARASTAPACSPTRTRR